ncbi:unnamed protein product [Eruca vesicaria subsp. sativa]|uniref:F-box domain-containing protein n=1 Tax=Eruca vesicaria subsp. sativa TaxID=29727 RepID=A0ABC8JWR0_ERUVS|nr:unnamed protein product [Eruca vesicaria subsp. sativa]
MKKKLSRKERKRRNKNKNKVCGWLSNLPDDVVTNCLVHVSRVDLAAIGMTSKAYRSLTSSPYLWNLRWQMNRLEASYYVCLHIFPEPIPRWFILHPVKRHLKPIHCKFPESGSAFVVVDWGIFIIGGLVNGKPTSEVVLFDCFEHKWHNIPPMRMPRASASARRIDYKIYVFGGCGDEVDSSNWAEVYDLRAHTWEFVCVPTSTRPKNIKQSVVIDNKEVYAVDEDHQIFSFSPSKLFASSGKTDSKPGDREDWCCFGGFLFARGSRTILWCLPDELDWKEVKGLEELQQLLVGTNDICKLSCKLSPNKEGSCLVIFWNTQPQGAESLELWSAEISLEKIGPDLWGKIKWSGSVYKLDYPLTDSNRVKVLYADIALT